MLYVGGMEIIQQYVEGNRSEEVGDKKFLSRRRALPKM
jgi:hypothetical protein